MWIVIAVIIIVIGYEWKKEKRERYIQNEVDSRMNKAGWKYDVDYGDAWEEARGEIETQVRSRTL